MPTATAWAAAPPPASTAAERGRPPTSTRRPSRKRNHSARSTATRSPAPCRRVAKSAPEAARASSRSSARAEGASLLHPLRTFRNVAACAPRHDRHRGGRILRRAFDQPVRIDHIDEHVPLCVAAADDLHLLEEQRAAPSEYIVALFELGRDLDRADLPAGERDVGDLFCEPEPAFPPALLGRGEMARDTIHDWIVHRISREFVVRRGQMKHCRLAKDEVRLIGRLRHEWHERENESQCDTLHGRAPPAGGAHVGRLLQRGKPYAAAAATA